MALNQVRARQALEAAFKDQQLASDIVDIIDNVEPAEAAFLEDVTAGTAAANKAVVLGASKEISTITTATITNATVTALTLGATVVDATAAEINAACDVSARFVTITDANTAIDAANSGKLHVIPDVTADRTFTLPTAAAGLEYRFIPKLNAADGHDWIISTGSDTNFFVGGVMFLDTDAGAGADELVLVVGDGNSNSKLQVNLPQPGTVITCICDGTLWVLAGTVCSTTAPTFADQ